MMQYVPLNSVQIPRLYLPDLQPHTFSSQSARSARYYRTSSYSRHLRRPSTYDVSPTYTNNSSTVAIDKPVLSARSRPSISHRTSQRSQRSIIKSKISFDDLEFPPADHIQPESSVVEQLPESYLSSVSIIEIAPEKVLSPNHKVGTSSFKHVPSPALKSSRRATSRQPKRRSPKRSVPSVSRSDLQNDGFFQSSARRALSKCPPTMIDITEPKTRRIGKAWKSLEL
ncbi:hypothetical protein P9112_007366 [Eukaryota sp. TZLM1-RC]